MTSPKEGVGRVAVVTGASRGIGKAIAERFASAGMRVVASARTLDPTDGREGSLQETVEGIVAAGGEAVAVRSDLSRSDDRAALVDTALDRFGAVDVLVNNAAVTYFLPFEEFTEKRWRLMFEVQVRAPFELTQLVVPQMHERHRGWILNISSRAGIHTAGPPYPEMARQGGFVVYGMVKAALDRFSTALAAELYDDGIAVSSLSPWDNVATPGAAVHDLVEGFRLEGPEWIAEAALALCTGDPATLTGRVAYSQQLLAELQRRPELSA